MTDLDFWSSFGLEESLIFNKIGYQTNRQERYLLIRCHSIQIGNGVYIEIILTTTHTFKFVLIFISLRGM